MMDRPNAAALPAAAGHTRRGFLKGVGGVLAVGAIVPHFAPAASPAWRVAVSDLAVGLRQNLGLFAIAGAAGLDGVELDMGRLGRRPQLLNRLDDADERRAFLDQARTANVRIAALALSAFAEQSFARHPQAEVVAAAWLDALRDCGVRTGVLPFGPACDLTRDADRTATVERLKRLAGRAEREGVCLALQTPAPAETIANVLDTIGSPAIAACVPLNANTAAAVRTIGPVRVAQIRWRGDAGNCTTAALAAMPADWDGWLVIERTTPSDAGIVDQCALAARALVRSPDGAGRRNLL